jgi:hypothetical protein
MLTSRQTFLLLFISLLGPLVKAQQVGIQEGYDGSRTKISLRNTSLYKSNSVSKVMVHNSKGELYFMAEIDTMGIITKQGVVSSYRPNYLQIRSSIDYPDSLSTHRSELINRKTNETERIDSSSTIVTRTQVGDSLIEYRRYFQKSYVLGHIINSRNMEFNSINRSQKFYHVFMYKRNINKEGKWDSKKTLKRRFKTSYDSSTLYFCSETSMVSNFTKIDASRHRDIAESAFTQAFFRNILGKNYVVYGVEGEDFVKPQIKTEPPFYCGYARYQDRLQREYLRNRGKYYDDSNGLHKSYYFIQEITDYHPKKEEVILYSFTYEYHN